MTLHYDFPEISTIDDVIPHIEGASEFIVAKKPWGTVINYVTNLPATFPAVNSFEAAIRRECRGLIFYPDGRLMSRRFHKFFNIGERDDTREIDVSRPHTILLKLDGSMITPIFIDDGVRWGTKMGLTDVAVQAEVFTSTRPQYEEFARHCREGDMTPIFEWVSRKQRIVIDYPQDNLILTALRFNTSGLYVKFHDMKLLAGMYNIQVVDVIDHDEDFCTTVANIRASSDIEGVVVRFDDGHMVKLKADTYVSLHRAKSLLDNERDVVGLILDQKVDDLLPLLPDQDRTRLLEFAAAVFRDMEGARAEIGALLEIGRAHV